MIYFNMTCKKHFMLKHYRGMYESRHHYLDLVHIWIPIFKMEEIKSCAAPNLLGNLRSKKMFAGNGTGRIYSTRKSSKRKG